MLHVYLAVRETMNNIDPLRVMDLLVLMGLAHRGQLRSDMSNEMRHLCNDMQEHLVHDSPVSNQPKYRLLLYLPLTNPENLTMNFAII